MKIFSTSPNIFVENHKKHDGFEKQKARCVLHLAKIGHFFGISKFRFSDRTALHQISVRLHQVRLRTVVADDHHSLIGKKRL